MSDLKHLKLGELIDLLRTKGQTPVYGLHTYLSSYRGYYDRLSLEPDASAVYRADVLADSLEGQIGETRTGWKGGDYEVHRDRYVYLDVWGDGLGHMLVGFTDSGYDLRPILVQETW